MFKTQESCQKISMVHQFKTNLVDQDSNVGQVRVKTEPDDDVYSIGMLHKNGNVCRPLYGNQLTSPTILESLDLHSGSSFAHLTMHRTVNLVYRPKPDCFILPDVRNPDFFHDSIKMEPNEDAKFAVSHKVEPIHDEQVSPASTKLEHPDLNSDSEIEEQEFKNNSKKIYFEDHAATYPEEMASYSVPEGWNIRLPVSQNSESTGKTIADCYPRLENYNFSGDLDNNHCCNKQGNKIDMSKNSDRRLNHSLRVQRHSRNTVHACLHCTKELKCLEDLEKHHLGHERVEIRNKCLLCGKTFKVLDNLKKHMKKHTMEETNKYQRVNSDRTFQEVVQHEKPRIEMSTHLHVNDKIIHNSSNQIKDAFGEKQIPLKTYTLLHECIHCCKAFARKDDLNCHVLSHLGILPYKCHKCGKTFNRKQNLQRHLLSHTGDKPYKCGQCGKSFGLVQYLNIHLLSHKEGNPQKCSQCRKKFLNIDELHRHVLSHCITLPIKCNQCEKTFPQKQLLEVHMLSHSGKKPHDCSKCGRLFSQKYLLNKHFLTHTKEKPHHCSLCVKSFLRKSILNRHIRLSHLKRNPHESEQCENSFICEHREIENTLLQSGEPCECNQMKIEEPTDTNQTAECVEINQPIELTETNQPSEYVGINQPEPVDPIEITWPVDPVEINWPVDPVETNQPAEYVEIIWPVEPIETNQPSEYVEVIWPIESIGTNQPEQRIEPNKISTKKQVLSDKPTPGKKAKTFHKCSQCGKEFVRMDDYNNHVLSHSGENPHKCSQCGKTFNRKHNLYRHKILVHSADKPK